MFYEEKMIDGVLHCRSTPNGEWQVKPAQPSAGELPPEPSVIIDWSTFAGYEIKRPVVLKSDYDALRQHCADLLAKCKGLEESLAALTDANLTLSKRLDDALSTLAHERGRNLEKVNAARAEIAAIKKGAGE